MRRWKIAAVGMMVFVPVALSAQQPTQRQATAPGSGARLTLIRSCEVAEGRGEEARKWATDIVAIAKAEGTKPPFESARSYQEMFGELGRVHFILEFANLNAVGMWMAGPPPGKVQEMLKQAPTLFRNCKDTLLGELGQQQ